MNTKQLAVRSAVTVVATGLTLLSTGTSQAGSRGLSGARMSGGHGSINNGAIHQGMTSRAINRGHGADNATGRNRMDNSITNGNRSHAAVQSNGRDDHGRHRERGDDKGGNASITRGEREPGDDHGRHRERGDGKGGNAAAPPRSPAVSVSQVMITADAGIGNRVTTMADSRQDTNLSGGNQLNTRRRLTVASAFLSLSEGRSDEEKRIARRTQV